MLEEIGPSVRSRSSAASRGSQKRMSRMLWVALKYRLYDHVVAISEGIRRVLLREGVPGEQVTCVPSAVDTALYVVGAGFAAGIDPHADCPAWVRAGERTWSDARALAFRGDRGTGFGVALFTAAVQALGGR